MKPSSGPSNVEEYALLCFFLLKTSPPEIHDWGLLLVSSDESDRAADFGFLIMQNGGSTVTGETWLDGGWDWDTGEWKVG